MALLKSDQSRIRSLKSRCSTCSEGFCFHSLLAPYLIWKHERIKVFFCFPYSTSFWFPDWYGCRLSQMLLCVQRRGRTKLIPSSGPGLVLLALGSWWRGLPHLSAGQRFPQQSHQWCTCRLAWVVLTVPALYTKNLETRVWHTGKEAKILPVYFRF